MSLAPLEDGHDPACGEQTRLTPGHLRLTEFNVAISIISLFYLLVMLILTIMKVYYPIVGVVTSTIMVALYTTSVYGQAGPDYLDPRYPSPIPWYLTKSCDVAERYKAGKTCQIVKGTFAISVTML